MWWPQAFPSGSPSLFPGIEISDWEGTLDLVPQPVELRLPKMSCKNSNKAARAAAESYLQLISAGEPFRLLFPLGACIGIFGVLLWPLFVWKLSGTYPGQLHARIMIEGFLTAFVIGFLGTALPRLLGVPRLKLVETFYYAAALVVITFLHGRGRTLLADQIFFITLLLFVGSLVGKALLFRQDVPPPGFVLVALGMACGLLGSGLLVVHQIVFLPAWAAAVGKLLLNQGYLLLPIMGVGAFLLPRFFGLPNNQSFPESLRLPPGWLKRASFALLCGAIVLLGFVVESLESQRWGCALRMVGLGLYLVVELPIQRARIGGGSLAFSVRIALVSILAGYAAMTLWPAHTFSWLHLVFITGFSLLTFAVATRVVLGHSGQSAKFQSRLVPVIVLMSLVVLAMLTRVSADWMPVIQLSHYAYAAISWIIGVLVWVWFILPGVQKADSEE